jgi:hypothetical protein
MRSLIRLTSLTLVLVFSVALYSGAEEKPQMPDYMKPYTGSAEFEQIKSLTGSWSGTGMMHGEEKPVSIVYKTTAGGSVVVETLFPDTPQEMISVYYEKDGQLVMTHFCMMKNQPELALKNSGEGTLEFDLVGGTNLDASKDMHMHSLTLTIKDDDTMVQEWTPFVNGKAKEKPTTLNLTRAQ